MLLHDLQELHHHLAGGADEHLALATALSIGDGLEAVSQSTHQHHLGGCLSK